MPRGRLEAPPTPRARMEDAWLKAPAASPRLPFGIMTLQAWQRDRRDRQDMSGRARRPVLSWHVIGWARGGGWPASGTLLHRHQHAAVWHA